MKVVVLLVAICALAVFLSPKERRQRNGVIAIVICTILGGGYFFILDGERDINKAKVSELSIDGISLGMSSDEMQKIMGKEKGSRKEDKSIYYDYDGLSIAIENDKVTGLYTNDSSRKTKRGIHAGSSYDDMVKSYGQKYEESRDDNDVTYIYTISDDNGNKGLFMFVMASSDKKIKEIYCFAMDEKEESTDKTSEGSELSLGGAELGMNIDSMHKVLGIENTTKNADGRTIYDYDTMDVLVENNKVIAIQSLDSHVKTKRGIHAGSSYDDMKRAYGTKYTETKGANDTVIYMYNFTENNEQGVLFFIIKNSDKTVGKILCMYISDKKKQPEQTSSKSTSSNTAEDNNNDAAVNSAYQVLAGYHQSITRGDLNTAWSYLTDEQKRDWGSYQRFQQGYSTTISSQLQNVEVKEKSATQVAFTYDIVARDRGNNGVKVQTFSGGAVVKAENGKWKIAYTTAKKTGEHME